MSKITSLPLEVLQQIFHELQSLTSGPRYRLVPPKLSDVQITDHPEVLETRYLDSDLNARWRLIDPGPIFLASTCRKLGDLYRSSAIAGNLVLQIPAPPADDRTDTSLDFWRVKERNGNLLEKLQRMKHGYISKPLTRFILDSRWEARGFTRANHITDLCREVWREILKNVVEVFGDGLRVVVCCQGQDVLEDFRQYAPKYYRDLEAMDKTMGSSLENTTSSDLEKEDLRHTGSRRGSISLRNGRNVPALPPAHPILPTKEQLSTSAPLSLHLYFGYKQHSADILMGDVLSIFVNKNLQNLYFCSDPNNLYLVGHCRRPAQGHELYKIKNPYFQGNPWRFLLPFLSAACETLEVITLDCSLFWSEIAYVIPHLHQLRTLDCEMTLLHSEPMYPFPLEVKEAAGSRILSTCLNSEVNLEKERALKKNKGKKWIDIKREGIILPAIEPLHRYMPIQPTIFRWSSVKMPVTLQFMKRLITRSRRENNPRYETKSGL
jgi:hypothetical protein